MYFCGLIHAPVITQMREIDSHLYFGDSLYSAKLMECLQVVFLLFPRTLVVPTDMKYNYISLEYRQKVEIVSNFPFFTDSHNKCILVNSLSLSHFAPVSIRSKTIFKTQKRPLPKREESLLSGNTALLLVNLGYFLIHMRRKFLPKMPKNRDFVFFCSCLYSSNYK